MGRGPSPLRDRRLTSVAWVLLLASSSIIVGAGLPVAARAKELAPTAHRSVLPALTATAPGSADPVAWTASHASPAAANSTPFVNATLDLANGSLVPGNYRPPSGEGPDSVVVDSGRGEIFVADSTTNTVTVTSAKTHGLLATIVVGTEPRALAYDPHTGIVFVATWGGGLEAISDANDTVVKTASAPDASAVSYDSGRNEVFVGCVASAATRAAIRVFGARSLAPVATIWMGSSIPGAIAYDNRSGEIVVATGPSSTPGNLTLISDATDRIVANVSVGGQVVGVAYDYGSRDFYATTWNIGGLTGGNVVSVSDRTDNVTARIALSGYPGEDCYDARSGEIFVPESIASGGAQYGRTVAVILDTTPRVNSTVGHLGFEPVDCAWDRGAGQVIVDDFLGQNLEEISDTTDLLTSTITLTQAPGSIVFDNGTGQIFVAEPFAAAVCVVSQSNDSIVATIRVGYDPMALAYDAAKGEVFVADFGADEVQVISDVTDRVVASVPVTYPEALVYDPARGEVFVFGNVGWVSVISDRTNSVVAGLSLGKAWNAWVGSAAAAMTYDPHEGEVWVAYTALGEAIALNDTTDKVVARIGDRYYPSSIAFDSSKDEIYVVATGGIGQGVLVISDSTKKVVGSISLGNIGASGIAFDNATGDLYLACFYSSNVTVIADGNQSVVATVAVGADGGWPGVAYDWRTGAIYVGNPLQGTISILD